jgi:hypothetical protein
MASAFDGKEDSELSTSCILIASFVPSLKGKSERTIF